MKRAILLATVAGLAVRLMTLPEVRQGERVLWYDADSAYHMHRVARTLENFPWVPWFDPMANAPEGFRCHWPPGFDALLAGTAWAAGGGSPSTTTVTAVGAWAPAVLGALTIPVAGWIGWELFGPSAAVWTAWALALLPGHVLITMAGRADHHAAEPLIWGLAVACALAAVRRGSFASRAGSARMAWCAMGLACAAAVALWPGGYIVTIVLGLGLALQSWPALASTTAGGTASGAALGFGVATVGILPLCAASPLGRAGVWSYEELSWLQPFVVLGAALLPPVAARRRWAIAASAGLVAVVLIWPGALRSLMDGLGFILRRDPWIAFTEESEPLFVREGHLTAVRLISHLTPAAFLVPGLWLWAMGRLRRRPVFWVAAVWSAAGLALMVAQTRFETVGVLPLVMLFGGAAAVLTARLGRSASIALALLVWLPAGMWLPGIRNNYRLGTPSPAALEMLDFLSSHPGGTVMASPWMGHWIETYGRRPVIANSIHTNRSGNMDFARFVMEEDEEAAVALLSRRGVRHVVLGDSLVVDVQQAALALGVDPDLFVQVRGKEVSWSVRGRRLVAAHLYLGGIPRLNRFRRVFATEETSPGSGRPQHEIFTFRQGPFL